MREETTRPIASKRWTGGSCGENWMSRRRSEPSVARTSTWYVSSCSSVMKARCARSGAPPSLGGVRVAWHAPAPKPTSQLCTTVERAGAAMLSEKSSQTTGTGGTLS